ncbi:MAG: aspartate-semialdehyde dehydrogenase [Clostridia bacterium]|jgi:aspartate-semialdehyde dehydrogenase
MKIAIVGTTGMVGRTLLKVLEEEKIEADYYLFASAKSAGTKINMFGNELTVLELTKANAEKVKPDFALFAADEGAITLEFVPFFAKTGCIVIDNSSIFRQVPSVPLVVPECNATDLITYNSNIIANPNCSTICAVVPLKPLDDAFEIKRIVYSTYQAVSGAGQLGLNDYIEGVKNAEIIEGKISVKKYELRKFDYPIFNNIIPHIDVFLDNGNTKEEEKMINETRKILHHPNLSISSTAVRVPVENCHCVSINVEFTKNIDIALVKNILQKSPGVILYDDPTNNIYPMPITANGKNEVYVGRVRLDNNHPNTINMFAVSDNIRKGAAVNAVQILKLCLCKKY